MVVGAPLEDARHLAQRYDRVRQEVEAQVRLNRRAFLQALEIFLHFFDPTQVIEVSRRQAKVRETNGNPDAIAKLEASETKLEDLKSNMTTLGKEATAAMAAVEGQQQRLTLQRLITMVHF